MGLSHLPKSSATLRRHPFCTPPSLFCSHLPNPLPPSCAPASLLHLLLPPQPSRKSPRNTGSGGLAFLILTRTIFGNISPTISLDIADANVYLARRRNPPCPCPKLDSLGWVMLCSSMRSMLRMVRVPSKLPTTVAGHVHDQHQFAETAYTPSIHLCCWHAAVKAASLSLPTTPSTHCLLPPVVHLTCLQYLTMPVFPWHPKIVVQFRESNPLLILVKFL
ncbi:hypothetical protein EDB19DRAFT_1321526 [Suillus lakei]|nr:hypothetical protein EDB19DRAFT_1321526 [Suillus lakei]